MLSYVHDPTRYGVTRKLTFDDDNDEQLTRELVKRCVERLSEDFPKPTKKQAKQALDTFIR